MNCLMRTTGVAVLSLLAGTACTASEQVPKANGMQQVVNEQSLRAGIEPQGEDSAAEQSFSVIFYIANATDQAVSVLAWNTPLEKELSADVFDVSLDGQLMPYQGRMVKRGTPQPTDFIHIPAGGRVEADVDIARYYDMSAAGSYRVSYKADMVDGVTQLNQQTPVSMVSQVITLDVDR